MTGQMLAGRTIDGFVLTEPIGKGVVGTTYLAAGEEADALAIFKILDAEDYVYLLQSAYRSKVNIDHEAVVPFDKVEKRDEVAFMKVPFVGLSLGHCLKNDGALPPEEALGTVAEVLQIFMEIGSALHGDLRPENLFRTEEGLKITDFGLSEMVRKLDFEAFQAYLYGKVISEGFLPSFHYQPPSRLEGNAATVQSELHSMGILALQFLTGHVSYKAARSKNQLPEPVLQFIGNCLEGGAFETFRQAFDRVMELLADEDLMLDTEEMRPEYHGGGPDFEALTAGPAPTPSQGNVTISGLEDLVVEERAASAEPAPPVPEQVEEVAEPELGFEMEEEPEEEDVAEPELGFDLDEEEEEDIAEPELGFDLDDEEEEDVSEPELGFDDEPEEDDFGDLPEFSIPDDDSDEMSLPDDDPLNQARNTRDEMASKATMQSMKSPNPADFGLDGDDPFGDGPSGQQGGDPFASGGQGTDPFASGGQGQQSQGSDPFASGGGGQQGQGADPFASPAGGPDPFASPGGQGADPFASPSGGGQGQQQGGGGDPFAPGGGQPQQQQGGDPFAPPPGGGQGQQQGGGGDPFAPGGGQPQQQQGGDPFAPPPGGGQGGDPFASGGGQGAQPQWGPPNQGQGQQPQQQQGGDPFAPPPGPGGQQGGGQQGGDPFAPPAGGGQQPQWGAPPNQGQPQGGGPQQQQGANPFAPPPGGGGGSGEPEPIELDPAEALRLLEQEQQRRSGKVPAVGGQQKKKAPKKKRPARPAKPEKKQEESGACGVVISGLGVSKKRDKAAKILADVRGVSLDEAKNLVRKPVITVCKNVSEEKADRVHARFKEAGITARITKRNRRRRKGKKRRKKRRGSKRLR